MEHPPKDDGEGVGKGDGYVDEGDDVDVDVDEGDDVDDDVDDVDVNLVANFLSQVLVGGPTAMVRGLSPSSPSPSPSPSSSGGTGQMLWLDCQCHGTAW